MEIAKGNPDEIQQVYRECDLLLKFGQWMAENPATFLSGYGQGKDEDCP